MNIEKLNSESIIEFKEWLKDQYDINLEEQLSNFEEVEILENLLNLIKFENKAKIKKTSNNSELASKLTKENQKLEETLSNLNFQTHSELQPVLDQLSLLLNKLGLLELNSTNLINSIIQLKLKFNNSQSTLNKLNLIQLKLDNLINYNNVKLSKINNMNLTKDYLKEINLNNTQLQSHLDSLTKKAESYKLELNHYNAIIPKESIDSLDIPSVEKTIESIEALNASVASYNEKLLNYKDLPPDFDESKLKLMEMESELDLLYLRHEQLVNNLTAEY